MSNLAFHSFSRWASACAFLFLKLSHDTYAATTVENPPGYEEVDLQRLTSFSTKHTFIYHEKL